MKIIDRLLVILVLLYLSLFIYPFAGITNIAGPTVGLFFIIFLRYFAEKHSFLENSIVMRVRGIREHSFVFVSIAVLFLALSSISIARHLALASGSSDLGIFDQAIWNTAQGDILFSSLKGNINLLGDHFEPILLLIAPIYKIWPNPAVLLLLQSFLLATAVIPLYLIAKLKLKERLLVFAFIIAYVLSKPLRGVAFSDFHPECFMVPLLFWAYYFLVQKRNVFLFGSLLLLLACKEDTAFLVGGLGIFALFPLKRFKLGFGLIILSIFAWVLSTMVIIPYFNAQHVYPYMNRLAENIMCNPLSLGNLFLDKARVAYLLKMFGPLGFLSLFSPQHYILFAIPLLKNLAASDSFSGFYNITSHYTAGIIPFLYISAIYAAGWILEKIRLQKIVAFMAFFIILSSLLFYGKTDSHKFARFMAEIRNKCTLQKLAYLKQVPAGVSVSTNFNLVPHLSQRKYIFEWSHLRYGKTRYSKEIRCYCRFRRHWRISGYSG